MAIAFFMGALVFGYAETVNSVSNPLSTLPAQSDTQTDYQPAQPLMQSAQVAPTIWLNTDTSRSEIAAEVAAANEPPDYQLMEADPILSDQTCSSDDLFPALPKGDYFSTSNPVQPWEFVTRLLTLPIDQKYYIPIISPLKNVDQYSLVDDSMDNDGRTVRPVLGCNEQAMAIPASVITALNPLSILLDYISLR
ncbi:MAG: hypothetical protein H6632_07900 [Anaerolineales bacterium]|nr:hypothetical protein [Anaerolineales bacterium]